MNFSKKEKAYLILADGTIFEGKSFGISGKVIGEVVFTTAMVGYQEMLTDPTYYGQLVTQTFPLIGNYGTNDEDFESKKAAVSGYIVREHCEEPSNFRCKDTLDNFMKKEGIIGIYDIDTRHLTKIIREKGDMFGMITTNEQDKNTALDEIKSFKPVNAAEKTAVKSAEAFTSENGKYNVVMLDFGYKRSILNALISRGCNVTVLPYTASTDEIMAMKPDGILLSNGGGNPEENKSCLDTVKAILEKKIPTFGIGMGHQILALSNGCRIAKLKHGHRGANQPVKDIATGRTLITNQRHGYFVDNVADACKITHENGNDKTCEGLSYSDKAFSVQFHPDVSSKLKSSENSFDCFVKLMEVNK